MQTNTDAYINNFAVRCFRDTADRDYIHARLAYQHGLIPQFRWSSMHCLEKYGKCILLINRITALKTPTASKSIGHEVLASLERIKQNATFEVKISGDTRKFITALERNASDRYLEYSWHNFGQSIHDLDLAVWEIRRYCQPLIYTRNIRGVETDIGPSNIARVESFKRPWNSQNFLNGGWLEKVFKNKNNSARAALIRNNIWFSAFVRAKINVHDRFESEVAPMDLSPQIRQEISKYVRISK